MSLLTCWKTSLLYFVLHSWKIEDNRESHEMHNSNNKICIKGREGQCWNNTHLQKKLQQSKTVSWPKIFEWTKFLCVNFIISAQNREDAKFCAPAYNMVTLQANDLSKCRERWIYIQTECQTRMKMLTCVLHYLFLWFCFRCLLLVFLVLLPFPVLFLVFTGTEQSKYNPSLWVLTNCCNHHLSASLHHVSSWNQTNISGEKLRLVLFHSIIATDLFLDASRLWACLFNHFVQFCSHLWRRMILSSNSHNQNTANSLEHKSPKPNARNTFSNSEQIMENGVLRALHGEELGYRKLRYLNPTVSWLYFSIPRSALPNWSFVPFQCQVEAVQFYARYKEEEIRQE